MCASQNNITLTQVEVSLCDGKARVSSSMEISCENSLSQCLRSTAAFERTERTAK